MMVGQKSHCGRIKPDIGLTAPHPRIAPGEKSTADKDASCGTEHHKDETTDTGGTERVELQNTHMCWVFICWVVLSSRVLCSKCSMRR